MCLGKQEAWRCCTWHHVVTKHEASDSAGQDGHIWAPIAQAQHPGQLLLEVLVYHACKPPCAIQLSRRWWGEKGSCKPSLLCSSTAMLAEKGSAARAAGGGKLQVGTGSPCQTLHTEVWSGRMGSPNQVCVWTQRFKLCAMIRPDVTDARDMSCLLKRFLGCTSNWFYRSKATMQVKFLACRVVADCNLMLLT